MPALKEILKPLDPGASQPLYQQLQRAIREAIDNRLLSPDDALPASSEAIWRSAGRASSGLSRRLSIASRMARCSCW